MSFLELFDEVMLYLVFLSLFTALGVYIYYNVRLFSFKEYKERFDFINEKESIWLVRVFIIVGVCVAFVINRYGSDDANLQTVGVWFFVRGFFSIAGGTLVAYVASLVIKFYYPSVISSKLKKWRYMPRKNPTTGNVMRLLTEEEEDVHLKPGMQAEERILSVDYDVWIDDQTEEVKVEKYFSHLIALKCNGCGYYTMKVFEEEGAFGFEISKNDEGVDELIKHYKCIYCKCVRATAFNISKNNNKWLIYRKSDNKTLKSSHYSPANLKIILESNSEVT